MSKMSSTAKQMLWAIALMYCIALFIGILLEKSNFGAISYFIGLSFGTTYSAFKVVFLERSIKKTLDMDKNKAVNHTQLNYLIRYFLALAVLLIAAFVPFIDLIGTAIGVLFFQFSAYVSHFFLGKFIKT